MLKRRKIYFYSEDSVSYVEAKGFRIKLAALVSAVTLFLLFALGTYNQFAGDFLGLGITSNSSLYSENQILKKEIASLNSKLLAIAGTLNELAKSDNQLRTAVNLPKIDVETRMLGTGGAAQPNFAGIVSSEAGSILANAKMLAEKLDREIKFQQESYKDIYTKSEENKILFSSLPAIKPMEGTFSYHGFGYRVDPFLGVNRMHEGVDIHNDVGTPVYATGDGVVEFSGNTGSAYGVALEINHGFGYKTWYAHLSRTVVGTGKKVKRGMLVAYSGNTGRSTGPHLHYEIRYNGVKKNPVEFFVSDVDYDKIRAQLANNKTKEN